ncbi:Nif11-like leader peptide family natural product precursor [Sinorhizobium medicae]|uniref:Nif11-like leader peptide family natural product precursor n=1 Tax=Sinorhizobium medicae TaxID=110321 RepID=UPI000FDB37E6|nr:Nif11-like leader peptide family natural product precursor [Sinorhizobium medicae]RVJ34637.1 Nif11 family protein [Sinorhizobium medicae]
MTKADLHRFVDDLEKDGDLLEAVKPKATGLAALVAAANERGYEFTLDEAKTYIKSRSPGDPNVNAVVDGKLKSDVATSTKVFQTAAVATTAVQAAEAATTVLTTAEAVVTVVVVVI